MANNIGYRKGTIKDIPAFLAFFKMSMPSLFSHYSSNIISFTLEVDYGPKWLTEKLTKGGKWVYLAFDDKKIVGYIFVTKSIAGVSFADWLGVDKQYQKHGIASRLLSLWEQEALIEGAHALHLWTTENNVEFYKKRGLSCGGLFPKAWYGKNTYFFFKTLREPDEKNFLKNYLQKIKKT